MTYVFPQKVLFRHCDPARIVFFPRYFEMMNDCVEAFFAERLNAPFETLHQSGAVPTAQIETRFVAPSRHGDALEIKLEVVAVSTRSLRYEMRAFCGDELRFETVATLVHTNREGRAAPWPHDLHASLLAQKKDAE